MVPGAPSCSRILFRLPEIAGAGATAAGKVQYEPSHSQYPAEYNPKGCDPGVGGCRPNGGHHPDSDADESQAGPSPLSAPWR
jgi:hypothetical protein